MTYLGGSASKTSWRSPLYSSMLRYRTNAIMAKVPGAVDHGGRPLHNAYPLHRKAKALLFASTLSCLPTVDGLWSQLGFRIPIPLLDTSYNFARFVPERSALPRCSTEPLVLLP